MGLNTYIPSGPVVPKVNSYTCEIPMTLTPEDNQSYANYIELPVVECKEIPLNSTADFWNCNLCGSDTRYEQPVIAGDTFRIQIPITNAEYSFYYAYLFDSDDNIIEDSGGIIQAEIWDGFRNKFLNIQLIADNIPSNCFYIKIFAFADPIDEGTLAACEIVKIYSGRGEKEAELLCLIEQQPTYGEFYSEIYRKVDENCEDLLLIEGEYARFDCRGNFYGVPQIGTDQHELKIRIPGTIERTEYNFEETIVYNTKRSSKQSDTFLFRTDKLPPYVAEQLALIFNSKSITIDGVVYRGGVKLSKDFDDGTMWIISTTLQRECDELDFLC